MRGPVFEGDARNILDIALDIHMTTTGSMERSYGTGEAEQAADIAYLKERLAEWEPSIGRSGPFDDACKAVIKTAILEAKAAEDIKHQS